MDKNKQLAKSFVKVAQDNFKKKNNFSITSLLALNSIYKKQNKKVMYLIIFKGDDVLTTSRILYSGKTGYINFIRTNKKFRGMGLCKRNVRKLLYVSHTILGLNNFSLEVNKENIPAISCYQKVGFEIVSSNNSEHKMIYKK
jgi:RimJ/RimL family protein N-acetyltransferase